MPAVNPIITWSPPGLLLVGMLVDSALNATATDSAGNAVPGTFIYSPAAGSPVPGPTAGGATVLPLVVNVTFKPTDLTAFNMAAAAVTIPAALAYTIPTEARQLMATIPAVLLQGLAAMSDADLITLLATASEDIDAAMRYQGRKYDPTQLREFPRIDASPSARQYPPAPPSINDPSFYIFGGSPVFIFDWDPNAAGGAGDAVVPTKVKLATIHQAAWMLDPTHAQRLEAIRSGLAAQGIGSGSETYLKPGDLAAAGGAGGMALGNRAAVIMSRYRLHSGRVL